MAVKGGKAHLNNRKFTSFRIFSSFGIVISFIAYIWAESSTIFKCSSILFSMVSTTIPAIFVSWKNNWLYYFASAFDYCIVFGLVIAVGWVIPILNWNMPIFITNKTTLDRWPLYLVEIIKI